MNNACLKETTFDLGLKVDGILFSITIIMTPPIINANATVTGLNKNTLIVEWKKNPNIAAGIKAMPIETTNCCAADSCGMSHNMLVNFFLY